MGLPLCFLHRVACHFQWVEHTRGIGLERVYRCEHGCTVRRVG